MVYLSIAYLLWTVLFRGARNANYDVLVPEEHLPFTGNVYTFRIKRVAILAQSLFSIISLSLTELTCC